MVSREKEKGLKQKYLGNGRGGLAWLVSFVHAHEKGKGAMDWPLKWRPSYFAGKGKSVSSLGFATAQRQQD